MMVDAVIDAACADNALIKDPPPIDPPSSQPPPNSSSSISSFTCVGLQSSSSSQSLPGILFIPVDMDAILISVGNENILLPVTLSTPIALVFCDGYSAFGFERQDNEFTIVHDGLNLIVTQTALVQSNYLNHCCM